MARNDLHAVVECTHHKVASLASASSSCCAFVMSSSSQAPPFKAEHIGSLLRPEELVQHRYAVADSSKSQESLVPVEQNAIREVVKLQQDCGIHSITNGEYSRHMFWGTFFETLNGMEEINLRDSGYDQSIFRGYAPGR